MKKVLLSDSGPETSDSIYSFWRWENDTDLNIEKVTDIISHTLNLGINAFDVSPLYGGCAESRSGPSSSSAWRTAKG